MTDPRQLPLIPYDGTPYAKSSETSRRAAVSQVPKRDARKVQAVEEYERAGHRGLTDYELATLMNLPIQSIPSLRARCGVDRRWGVFRDNLHGNPCQVWKLLQSI